MRLFFKSKDGGPESNCTGYWLIESKKLFSICLLKFEGKSRDAFHSHAFNSVSWLIKGALQEIFLDKLVPDCYYIPSVKPIFTYRETIHKVNSFNNPTWVLSLRGPWVDYWQENIKNKFITLTHGRKIV